MRPATSCVYEAQKDRVIRMQLSLNGVILGSSLSFEEYLALAAKTGFGGVDTLADAMEIAETRGIDAVHGLIEQYGVKPAVWGIPVDWKGSDAEFEAGLTDFPRYLEFAVAVGCPRGCTWLPPTVETDAAEFRAMAVERWRKIGQVAEPYGVRLGLEWVGPATLRKSGNVFLYRMDQLLELEDEIGVDCLGLLVDSFHWYTAGHTAEELATLPVEKIVHVHINDAPDRPVDEQIDGERLLPGEGIIDLAAFLGALKTVGYEGYLGMETFSEELKALPVEEAAARAKAAGDRVLAAI
jgi:sugar phosphate isomerase/epimerase